LTAPPELDAGIAVEPHDPELGNDLLVNWRTITWVGDGLGEISAESVAPPPETESAAMGVAPDHLGYTGPRQIRLLLAIAYLFPEVAVFDDPSDMPHRSAMTSLSSPGWEHPLGSLGRYADARSAASLASTADRENSCT
jgi:hypothetical protein